jgi:hypothetical protein
MIRMMIVWMGIMRVAYLPLDGEPMRTTDIMVMIPK